MHAPSAVFIDTCIFESVQFDFKSPQFEAFIAALKGKQVQLLLPHPTEQEIDRHIENNITAAVSALKAIRQDHSFLRALPQLPQSREDRENAERELRKYFRKAWLGFKKKFELVTLGYEGIDLSEVMSWYDRQEAPFGSGDKRKEFPDAFAFCALRNYAQEQKANIAVVSADNDFRKACEPVSQLHHFPSLASFTNALLKGETRFAAAVSMATCSMAMFAEQIAGKFPDLGFSHEIDPDSNSDVSDVKVKEVTIDPDSVAIIGLGHDSFIVSFCALVSFSAWVQHVDADSWVSLGDGDVMYLHHCEGTVDDETEINCVVRVSTNTDWSAIKNVISFKIEEDFITVQAEAPQIDDRDAQNEHG